METQRIRVFSAFVLILAIGVSEKVQAYKIYILGNPPDSSVFNGKYYPQLGETENDVDWEFGEYYSYNRPPVFWDQTSVTFYQGAVTADIHAGDQTSAIQASLNTWDSTLVNYLDVLWGSGTNDTLNVNDGKNTIAFGEWSDLGVNPGRTMFKVNMNPQSSDFGEIIETDIILNDKYDWTITTMTCGGDTTAPDRTDKDIQSILTHELGHALGLGHAPYAQEGCMPTMIDGTEGCNNCLSEMENEEQRSLNADDTCGADEIYGPGCGSDSTYVREQSGSAKWVIRSRDGDDSLSFLLISPNPFNPKTVVGFGLTQDSEVSLAVYDLTGQVVAELIKREWYPRGTHCLEWEVGANYASGVYLVRLVTPYGSVVQKISLVK